jgi:hypothetical protein
MGGVSELDDEESILNIADRNWTQEWRRLHNEELHNLQTSPNTITVII